MKNIRKLSYLSLIVTLLAALTGCEKTESYSELLRKEEKAVNWYLSGESIDVIIPADSVFIQGEEAPYYKMDEDGNVYMKVISSGNPLDKPAQGERVYFRFSMMNLRNLYEADREIWEGNSSDINSVAPTSFIYGNYTLQSSYQYGTGIQLPMKYLGYNSHVRLVVKSQAGFTNIQSQCLPYVFDVRYFKGEY